MKINDIFESTTSGSIAPSVATVGKMHSRNLGIYPGKAGSMFQGKNTKAKFPNSISEDDLSTISLLHFEYSDMLDLHLVEIIWDQWT